MGDDPDRQDDRPLGSLDKQKRGSWTSAILLGIAIIACLVLYFWLGPSPPPKPMNLFK